MGKVSHRRPSRLLVKSSCSRDRNTLDTGLACWDSSIGREGRYWAIRSLGQHVIRDAKVEEEVEKERRGMLRRNISRPD